MKRNILILATLLISGALFAQDLEPIKLKEPNKNRGNSIMSAFENSKSSSEYSEKMLIMDDLSDLLWAANGINRPDGKKPLHLQ